VKHFYQVSELEIERQRLGRAYLEFLRIPAMSAGLYGLPAGARDPQSPHRQDEMYYVVRGRARMRVGREEQAVSTGSVIFVEAGVEHTFREIEEDLEVLVFFAPAES
jgi:mannose-6-phosphate isomerase-like protein (cupin superfamily)